MKFPLPKATDWASLAALAAVSVAGGLGLNAIRSTPLTLIYRSPSEALVASSQVSASKGHLGLRVASLEETRQVVQRKSVLVVDARPSLIFELGHLPGAVNLSRQTFDEDFVKLKDQLAEASTSGKPLLLYCADAQCPDAGKVAIDLQEKGFKSILLFEGGWEAWKSSDLPREQASN